MQHRMPESRFDDKPLAMLRRVGRETLARKMIDLFLTSAPDRAASIRGAHAAGDLVTAGRAAHSLKPSAGQLGAMALQSVCQQIEDAAAAGDSESVRLLLPALTAELDAAEAWLRALPASPAS
jgi:HPt (histidine-containing phosphotransfer) domain-containing protein